MKVDAQTLARLGASFDGSPDQAPMGFFGEDLEFLGFGMFRI